MTAPESGYLRLDDRALIRVGGADRHDFLQNLVTNDLGAVTPHRAIYTALLTAQGKYLHDFFIVDGGDALWLDCPADQQQALLKRLKMYRLRAAVELAPVGDELAVFAVIGAGAAKRFGLAEEPGAAQTLADGRIYVDPRHADMGLRAILPAASAPSSFEPASLAPLSPDTYERHRLRLGIPMGGADLIAEQTFALEGALDQFNGVSFAKGCYVGQEVTARMKHRDLVRKKLMHVQFDGPPPAPGTKIFKDGVEIGVMRSVGDAHGIALVRIDGDMADPNSAYSAGAARLTIDAV